VPLLVRDGFLFKNKILQQNLDSGAA